MYLFSKSNRLCLLHTHFSIVSLPIFFLMHCAKKTPQCEVKSLLFLQKHIYFENQYARIELCIFWGLQHNTQWHAGYKVRPMLKFMLFVLYKKRYYWRQSESHRHRLDLVCICGKGVRVLKTVKLARIMFPRSKQFPGGRMTVTPAHKIAVILPQNLNMQTWYNNHLKIWWRHYQGAFVVAIENN